MIKRFFASLLAVCIACSMLFVPASAASSNTAVQTAVLLGGMTAGQAESLGDPLTRGQLARMLTAFSSERESAGAQGTAGNLFKDVAGGDPLAPWIRVAVQRGWMSGYTDGTFRPGNPVTLEEACAAVLNLLGYDVTALSGTFPAAQLNKASELGLRARLNCAPGQEMNLEDGAVLLYNALTAKTSGGEVYAVTLGFTVSDGQVSVPSVLLGSLEGPFVAGENTQLPFAPAVVYRNDTASASADLAPYDVYYYSTNAQTVWIYTRKAAGRITAVAPSASAPSSVTVAGTEYAIGTPSAASVLSSLNGGGVGQVVTLLLGMDNQVVQVLTGAQADEVFYGVVQTASRNLVEGNGADVRQSVAVSCTDGMVRTVSVDKSLNFPAGTLVKITVDETGEEIQPMDAKHLSGTFNETGTALSGTLLAENAEILDTTAEGVAGAISPSRLSGVTLQNGDVRYYTTDVQGRIDRMILNNATGDLWTYGVLDDVRNLTHTVGTAVDQAAGRPSALTAGTTGTASTGNVAADVADLVLPSTSAILYGIIDGSIASTLWDSLTSSTGRVAAYTLQLASKNTSGILSNILGWMGSGANYVCLIDGQNTTLQTPVKYPVVAGGIAVSKSPSGAVKSMTQLMPVKIDRIGAASVMSGDQRFETADRMQVYLWYKGQYFATSLSQVNPQDYHLIGWYDNLGCAAGSKIRVLVAVKKS